MRDRTHSIRFTKTSKKHFDSLKPKKTQDEVASVLEELARDPLIGKPLQGPLKGLRSKRIGKIRIIYKQIKSELVIIVISIEHRKKVYRRKG